MKNDVWCCKCGVRVGLSSSEFGSVTFKGKCNGVQMNHEFKLCGRCTKKISTGLKDRNLAKMRVSVEEIIVHSPKTNITEKAKKVEKQVSA